MSKKTRIETDEYVVEREWNPCRHCEGTGKPNAECRAEWQHLWQSRNKDYPEYYCHDKCHRCKGKRGFWKTSKHLKYPAIGGPLNGQRITTREQDYVFYNCGIHYRAPFHRVVMLHKSLVAFQS